MPVSNNLYVFRSVSFTLSKNGNQGHPGPTWLLWQPLNRAKIAKIKHFYTYHIKSIIIFSYLIIYTQWYMLALLYITE